MAPIIMAFRVVTFSSEALAKIQELSRMRDIKVVPQGFLTAEEANQEKRSMFAGAPASTLDGLDGKKKGGGRKSVQNTLTKVYKVLVYVRDNPQSHINHIVSRLCNGSDENRGWRTTIDNQVRVGRLLKDYVGGTVTVSDIGVEYIKDIDERAQSDVGA